MPFCVNLPESLVYFFTKVFRGGSDKRYNITGGIMAAKSKYKIKVTIQLDNGQSFKSPRLYCDEQDLSDWLKCFRKLKLLDHLALAGRFFHPEKISWVKIDVRVKKGLLWRKHELH